MGCCQGNTDDDIDITQGGLTKKRGCTDILCTILFFIFTFYWLSLAALAFENGDPERMLYPADSYGRLCGKNTTLGDFTTKKYVLYFDIAECLGDGGTGMMLNGGRCPSHQMCVDKCAEEFWIYDVDTFADYKIYEQSFAVIELPATFWDALYCTELAQITIEELRKDHTSLEYKTNAEKRLAVQTTITRFMDHGDCSRKQVPSAPVSNRCLPGTPPGAEDATDKCMAKESEFISTETRISRTVEVAENDCASVNVTVEPAGLSEIIGDLQQTWKLILFMLSFAIIISLAWIVFLRFLGGALVWVFVIGSNLLFGGLAAYSYFEWERLKNSGTEIDLITIASGSLLHAPGFWLGTMIVSGCIFIVLFIVTLCMIQRIRMATTIMEEATKAVKDLPLTMLFPLWMAGLYLLVIWWYTSVAASIATAATPIYRLVELNQDGTMKTPYVDIDQQEECNMTEILVNITDNTDLTLPEDTMCILDEFVGDYGYFGNQTVVVQFYHLFGFYWCMNIVSGIIQVTLAGCFSSWYFARRKPKDIPNRALWRGFLNCFWHFGTIVFGAFIISLIQILRAILNYIEKKTKRYQNQVVKAIICCLKCCLWCMEKCMKYISQNAYIITAMYGYGFIRSACKAMKLIIANAGRAAAVTGVTNMVLFVGKMLVSVGLALWSFYLFDRPAVETGVPCDLTDETKQENCGLLDKLVDDPHLIKSTEMIVLLVFLGSYMIASGFFKVYQMAIATIFICFLEDLERNDGSAQKPYFMSKSLMKIMGKKNAPEATNTTAVSSVKKK